MIRGYIVPNKFYLCVPEELVEWAKEYLEDKNEKYGLLSYDLARYTGKTHIINIKRFIFNLQLFRFCSSTIKLHAFYF